MVIILLSKKEPPIEVLDLVFSDYWCMTISTN